MGMGGLRDSCCGTRHWNCRTTELYEHVVRNNEGKLGFRGSLLVRSGTYTGRAAKDKHVVDHPETREHVWWNVTDSARAHNYFSDSVGSNSGTFPGCT